MVGTHFSRVRIYISHLGVSCGPAICSARIANPSRTRSALSIKGCNKQHSIHAHKRALAPAARPLSSARYIAAKALPRPPPLTLQKTLALPDLPLPVDPAWLSFPDCGAAGSGFRVEKVDTHGAAQLVLSGKLAGGEEPAVLWRRRLRATHMQVLHGDVRGICTLYLCLFTFAAGEALAVVRR